MDKLPDYVPQDPTNAMNVVRRFVQLFGKVFNSLVDSGQVVTDPSDPGGWVLVPPGSSGDTNNTVIMSRVLGARGSSWGQAGF